MQGVQRSLKRRLREKISSLFVQRIGREDIGAWIAPERQKKDV